MGYQARTPLPVFTTGTIQGNSGQAVVTGTGTQWTVTDANGNTVNQVMGGDRLILSFGEYTIKSVDSALQITLETNLTSSITAGTAYRIVKYQPNLTGGVQALVTALLAMGSDATPDAYRTIDNGAGRLKLRVAANGDLQLAGGPSGAADAALATFLDATQAGALSFPGGLLGIYLSGRNHTINGNYQINQRGYTSGSSLAAGAYGHDRWKAGSGGCTYTFTQGVPDTTITITAGSLVQIIDAPNVTTTRWIISWRGSAQARVWQGSATGSYLSGTSFTGADGELVNYITVTNITAGTAMAVEFTNGSLGKQQTEAYPLIGATGSAPLKATPTSFERKPYGLELELCQAFYQTIVTSRATNFAGSGGTYRDALSFLFPVTMRASPTVTLGSVNATNNVTVSVNSASATNVTINYDPQAAGYGFDAGRTVTLNAEL